MKTEEDEAFDELAKKQGMWGGGFQAKRAAAADKLHWSDCAVHNEPAYPAGPCDCGVAQEPVAWVGLTDEETQAYWDWEDWQTGAGRSTIFEMVRDIEAKLKEKNNGV